MGLYSGRRQIFWNRLKTAKDRLAFGIATAGGAGLFPVAPGTAGTAVAVPLAYWVNGWTGELPRLLFWIAVFGVGTWAAMRMDQLMETADNQNIVIDEVVGLGIAAWVAGQSGKALGVAFLLFRIFDVLKIPPVRQLDTWSKNQSSPWAQGFGVIADDVLAGFQALGVFFLLQVLELL
jgi:phosphatidylglycerophosphatase A